MPYTVELRFDPETERRFLGHWDTLRCAGITDWRPVTGRFDRLTLLRIRPGEVLWEAQLDAG